MEGKGNSLRVLPAGGDDPAATIGTVGETTPVATPWGFLTNVVTVPLLGDMPLWAVLLTGGAIIYFVFGRGKGK